LIQTKTLHTDKHINTCTDTNTAHNTYRTPLIFRCFFYLRWIPTKNIFRKYRTHKKCHFETPFIKHRDKIQIAVKKHSFTQPFTTDHLNHLKKIKLLVMSQIPRVNDKFRVLNGADMSSTCFFGLSEQSAINFFKIMYIFKNNLNKICKSLFGH